EGVAGRLDAVQPALVVLAEQEGVLAAGLEVDGAVATNLTAGVARGWEADLDRLQVAGPLQGLGDRDQGDAEFNLGAARSEGRFQVHVLHAGDAPEHDDLGDGDALTQRRRGDNAGISVLSATEEKGAGQGQAAGTAHAITPGVRATS